MPGLLDIMLAAGLVWTAWVVVASRDTLKAGVLFIVFTLVLSLAWVRLGAPDIALAEAAIGAGVTGALIIDTVGRIRRRDAERAGHGDAASGGRHSKAEEDDEADTRVPGGQANLGAGGADAD